MNPSVAALIVAAGSGTRFGGRLPKVYVPLCGVPMLAHSLRAYDRVARVQRIVVVAAPEQIDAALGICTEAGVSTPWQLVAGGERRQDSVRAGLQALAEAPPDLVCIHDAARPLVTVDIIEASIDAALHHGAAIACVQCTDTIKEFTDAGRVRRTPERACLRAIQTPQTFAYELIVRAHDEAERAGIAVTDDAAVVEALGHDVVESPGSKENIKVTQPEDLPYAEWLMAQREASSAPMRIGHGCDLHRLVAGRALILCGVRIPHDLGLLGHSDADVALHAVADAALGAAGLGDIGLHFPDTDPAYEGADSRQLLEAVVAMIAEAGYVPSNADVTIIAEQPKLSPHREAMVAMLADTLGLPVADVNVKATTNEGLGPTGEGKAISCHAVICLMPINSGADTRREDQI